MHPSKDCPAGFRIAHSCAADPAQAVREFAAGLAQPSPSFILFFCSAEYDLDQLAASLRQTFPNTEVAGCTTAGEIGPAGYRSHSLCGIGFDNSHFRIASALLSPLPDLQPSQSNLQVQQLLRAVERDGLDASWHSLAFLLIDGLSFEIDRITRILQVSLGAIPLVGGSASDSMKFDQTFVYSQGHFHRDAALLLLLHTRLPFALFKTQHYEHTSHRMVVTQADAAHRTVSEIDGLPAAREYARILGLPACELTPTSFAAHPVVVLIGGQPFVRSIACANPDGSLRFLCAIENGLVLRVARGTDLVRNLDECFQDIERRLGPIQLSLACDCILRRIEIGQKALLPQVEQLFAQHHTIGFNTFGEHYQGVNINQTLVGVAFGREPSHE